MIKMKDIMMKGMHKIMLDCEHASLLATKSDFEKQRCVKRIQLRMHLASCKFCRTFSEQSKVISNEMESMKEIDGNNLNLHLSDQQKEELQETVETNLKSN